MRFNKLIFIPLVILGSSNSVLGSSSCLGISSTGNTYPCGVGYGNCTWWSAHKRPELNYFGGGRDAKTWIEKGELYHFPTGQTPKSGSIAVFKDTSLNPHGHVAFVTAVNSDNSFQVTEQDYTGSYGVGTQTATYHPVSGGYKRHNGSYLGASTTPLLGFIYPTKMIRYESDEFSGVLRLDRFDGRKPASCEDAKQFVLYRSDVYSNGSISTSLVVSLLEENTGYLYCLEASNSSYAGDSVNFGSFIQTKTGVSFEDGVGGGSGGSTNNPTHPNLTVDLDLYSGGTRVDDKTHPYGFPLTLKAQIKVEDADASSTAEEGKEQIEIDFWWRIKNSANWNKANPRQYTDIDNLDKGDTHTESVTITPTYQTGTVIETRVCIDTEDEVRESKEGDNCDEEFTTLGTPPITKKPPIGYLDRANCSVLEGWAKDPNSTKSLSMHIYRDGKYFKAITANRYRKDLPFSDKNHGFRYVIPTSSKDGKRHTWRVYAIDDRVGGYAGNPRIGSDKAFTCFPPYKYVEPVWRAFDSSKDRYFLTQHYSEWNGLRSLWRKEGKAFYCHSRWQSGTTALYRVYRKNWNNGHFYTRSSGEYNGLGSDWKKEGRVCYVYTSPRPGTKPLHRLYKPHTGTHFFTIDTSEVSRAKKRGYKYEKVEAHVFYRDF